MKLHKIAVAIAAMSLAGAAAAAGTHQTSATASQAHSYSSSQSMGQPDGQLHDVQQALSQQGFNPGPADGILGPQTQQALRSFQQSHGLQASGKLDDQTRSALGLQGSPQSGSGGAQPSGMSSSGSYAPSPTNSDTTGATGTAGMSGAPAGAAGTPGTSDNAGAASMPVH